MVLLAGGAQRQPSSYYLDITLIILPHESVTLCRVLLSIEITQSYFFLLKSALFVVCSFEEDRVASLDELVSSDGCF